jgi:hypothetical protein
MKIEIAMLNQFSEAGSLAALGTTKKSSKDKSDKSNYSMIKLGLKTNAALLIHSTQVKIQRD